MKNDEKFMAEALSLALKGMGSVSPNPIVGAVVVRKGKIIGRGYHKKAGSHHAEVNAIRNTKGRLDGATLYVTLEPCSHHGRTPPCTEFIVSSGIKKVVYGMKDVSPHVNGRGDRYLRKHGIEVLSGVLRKECRESNKAFIKAQTRALPYLTLKLAMTLDGKIATSTGQSKWITGPDSRRMVHVMRSKADAIMVGAGTVNFDNPMLNVRMNGSVKSSNIDPVPIVIDAKFETSLSSKVYGKGRETIVYTSTKASKATVRRAISKGIDVVTMPETQSGFSLKSAMKDIASRGINSVLVEGGGTLAGSLLKDGLVDEVSLFIAPKIIGGEGLSAIKGLDVKNISKALNLKNKTITEIGDDILIEGVIGS